MSAFLNIAYITSREEPRLSWFLDSLRLQYGGDFAGLNVIVVDAHCGTRFSLNGDYDCVTITRPKPTVWQGPHRLTKGEYWAKCNAANTALCLAEDGWISFVDDLSVLDSNWLERVRCATARPMTCTLGSFKKVKNLTVEGGRILHLDEFAEGIDSRWNAGADNGPVPCGGDWMYGHVTAPVEAFLTVNGYPEALCDSLGFEDVLTGMAIQKAGYVFRYDRRMLIYESEELHHTDVKRFKRFDKGVSPNDKSHAALARVQAGDLSIWNHYDLRSLRERILRGEPFPPPSGPTTDWYDGQPLSEL